MENLESIPGIQPNFDAYKSVNKSNDSIEDVSEQESEELKVDTTGIPQTGVV